MRFILLVTFVGSTALAQISKPKHLIGQLPYRHILPEASYDQQLNKIEKQKIYFKENGTNLDTVKSYFLTQFEQSIFPYWVGTPWDYNGYANRPGKNQIIACGYFVSTPLKHMGFNLNRFKLAQMYSKKIAETLCNDVTMYDNKTNMLSAISASENNLYIVGLDSHVGMLLKSDSGLWFVHSNYYDLKGPDKEIASESLALAASTKYYLGTFSTLDNMSAWINNKLFITE